MRRMLLLASAFALVVPVYTLADDKADASKLVGTWTVTAEETGGTKASADKIKGKQVKITRDTITCMDRDGKTEMACKYEVTGTGTPMKAELTCTEGEHKGKKMSAILELEGDTLKCCHSKPGEEAPTKFETKEGQCCITLKRDSR